ncbi:hypothetical protein L916_17909 [Phytophthora nicotianae]|uniref:Uncharacterized protein n=1 Tax=Phytophthora nicotianae TaxID=4792 RepID=W2I3I1_PHYNI|nr:hypothetical protein L916_17909 [Phytophthora nicotianae]
MILMLSTCCRRYDAFKTPTKTTTVPRIREEIAKDKALLLIWRLISHKG